MGTSSSVSILLVSANESEASRISAVLEAEGRVIRHARSGEEALKLVRGQVPDVVLLDQALPEVTATDLCKALRSDPQAVVSILLCRHSGGVGALPDALAGCVDDVLAMPADPEELAIRVRNAIGGNRLRRKSREDEGRIRELEQTRDELTQLIARDMKAPLMGLADLLEMADRDSVRHFKSEASQYLNEALDATETLEEMVSFLSDVRRMLSGDMKPVRRQCDVMAMLRRVAELLGESASASGVAVRLEGKPVTMACDERLVERACRHVLRTAILESKAGGHVDVTVTGSDDAVRIKVHCPERRADKGEGSQYKLLHAENAQSAGLGLTFCRLVMEAHGGTFAMEPGSGSANWELNLRAGEDTAGGDAALVQAPASGLDVPLQRSRRYIGKRADPQAGARKPFAVQTTRYQFSIAIAIMSAIPLLSFGYLFAQYELDRPIKQESLVLILSSSLVLVLLGIVLLLRHVLEVGRLRRHLELIARGGVPGDGVEASSEDFKAISKAMGTVIEKADEKVRTIEDQVRARLRAEQQRVMVETVGAACHHLGQPATVIGVYLDLMKKKEVSPEMQRLIAECQLAAADVSGVLHRLQGVARYETEPYLSPRKAGPPRSDERILKI